VGQRRPRAREELAVDDLGHEVVGHLAEVLVGGPAPLVAHVHDDSMGRKPRTTQGTPAAFD